MDSLLLIHGTHQGQTVFAAVIPQSCDLKSPWQYKGWIGTGRPGRSNGEENLLYGKQWEAKENILFFLYHKGHMRGRGKQRVIHQSGIAARFPMAEEEGSNGAIRRTSEKSLSISSNRKILHKWLKEKSQFWRAKEQLEKDSLIKRYKICIFNKKKSITGLLQLPQPQGYSYLSIQNLARLFHWYTTWSVIQLPCTSLHQTATQSEDIFGTLPKSEPSCIFHMANIIKFTCTRSRTSTLSNRT